MTEETNAQFTALVDQTYDDLLRYAIRRVREPQDAADVVAETYAIAWRKTATETITDVRPWLFGVARNVVHAHRRGELRQVAIADELRNDLATRTETALVTELQLDVQAALATLSDEDFEVIALTAWDGLTTKELANTIGVSSAAARVRLHRARRRLKKALTETMQPNERTTWQEAQSC